jgi:hypothetical protein
MPTKKRQTILRLIEDREQGIASEVENWTNTLGNNGGWDRWFATKHPELAEKYDVGQGHSNRPNREKRNRRIEKAVTNDFCVPACSTDDALTLIEAVPGHDTSRQFDVYCFADYRGDAADKAGGIAVALGTKDGQVVHVDDVNSRRQLSIFWQLLIKKTDRAGARLIFGQDHQYGVPKGLLDELELRGPWREAMKRLFFEGQLGEIARNGRAGEFACKFNEMLRSRMREDYFWSATKGKNYGIPTRSPRPDDPHKFRITEQLDASTPFPFARIGDSGAVGGQTIVGIPNIIDLLESEVGSTIFAWPFDGLDLPDSVKHVLVEIYPSVLRPAKIRQSDLNDAVACVNWCVKEDAEGRLRDKLSTNAVADEHRDVVQIEGWYFGCQ